MRFVSKYVQSELQPRFLSKAKHTTVKWAIRVNRLNKKKSFFFFFFISVNRYLVEIDRDY